MDAPFWKKLGLKGVTLRESFELSSISCTIIYVLLLPLISIEESSPADAFLLRLDPGVPFEIALSSILS